MPSRHSAFRSHSAALLRAVARPVLDVPLPPDLTQTSSDGEALAAWLRLVWSRPDVAGALAYASPVLGRQLEALCAAANPPLREVRRAALAVTRYLLRATGRPTPFGWFSGVTAVSFGREPSARWCDGHMATVRAGSPWLTAVINRLEASPQLLNRLPVMANTSVTVRGDRLVVPYQPHPDRARQAVECSMAYSAPVRFAVATAASPIRVADLQQKLLAEFPATSHSRVAAMVRELVQRGVLISALHSPSTEPDGLRHLLAVLDDAAAADVAPVAGLVGSLRAIAGDLGALRTIPNVTAAGCAPIAERMRAVAGGPQTQPLAVDLRLDAAVTLPRQVADEVARAAELLARLCARPFGTPAWKAWHNRFYERYGVGALVPVLDVLADSGVGFPDGYPGAEGPERPLPGTIRDEQLMALAQRAALDGVDEIVLDEAAIARLEFSADQAGLPPHLHVGCRLPPHLEVAVQLRAVDLPTLRRGRFTLEVTAVSRGAGVLTGRFLDIVDDNGRAALAASLAALPGADPQTLVAQVSFPPLDPATAHVTRTPQLLPLVISIGEHRPPGPDVLAVADLAVGCDGRRLYLAVPKLGARVEAVGLHALNLHTHTPPLVRLLIELARANTAQVTTFDWGAARTLPFLPALRHGRIVLSPARWRLDRAELPAADSPWPDWDAWFAGWRARRRLPRYITLTEGDQRLPLDLDQPAHRVLLREHLTGAEHAVLTAVPDRTASGWCGGRSHELIVPLTAAQFTRWPKLPAPAAQRLVQPRHVHQPAEASVLLASLYSDPRRQDTLLGSYLPLLLDRLGGRPWWYVRYRDPEHHVRLRVGLADRAEFGPVAAIVAQWAEEMRELRLLRELRLPSWSPEHGRWGDGAAWQAAEAVFRADSHAMLTTLRQLHRPGRQALVAAHTVGIAAGFTGSIGAGMRWLADHVPVGGVGAINRPAFTEAVSLADPSNGWAALRAAPGGAAIADAWAGRDAALAAYRTHFPGRDTVGVDVDDVLGSLLHVMFVRAVGINFEEEAVCLHLARAAALTWLHRYRAGIQCA
ncbi:lantibiotic dehydratase [Dactylosporangium sp. CA-139066]|uniref:lantibiotic dehydratase n=1 Tax=Dactylosporangium sp. CA-139066 TaxID=3239930 RepID=UPI003D91A0E6